jgi:hypothetical protein
MNTSWLRKIATWTAWVCLLALASTVAACAVDRAPAEPAEQSTETDRAIIITVRTALSVEDVAASSDRLRKLVQDHGGLIANATVHGTEEHRVADFEIRVPSDKVGDFRAALGGLGQVDSESETIEDVTAPRADLEARLKNARAQEKRLLQLLQERTGTLADVIAIEKEIASVRENVERMEAEKRLLDGRVSMATLHVSLRPKHANLWSQPGDAIVSALGTGIRGARNLLVGGAVVGATILPSALVLALLGILLFLFARALLRRRARRSIATS